MWNIETNISFLSRNSHPEVFLVKGFLKICSKSTREHPCRSATSIKLLSSFIEITLRHGCSPVDLLHIFRKPFTKNTSGWLLLIVLMSTFHVKWLSFLASIKDIDINCILIDWLIFECGKLFLVRLNLTYFYQHIFINLSSEFNMFLSTCFYLSYFYQLEIINYTIPSRHVYIYFLI